MDDLRWFLLLFGLIVVVGVYLYSRRERTQDEDDDTPGEIQERLEPSLDGEPAGDEIEAFATSGEAPVDAESEVEPNAPEREQKIITLRIVARNNSSFAGDELALSLRGIGLRHGKFGIYHRHDGNDESKIIFSVASLVEPGSFDLKNLKSQEIPGISLFMVLPGPIDGAQAFDLMMVAARALSQSLDAELLDESGSTLSIQRERYMREEIVQFQTSNLVS
jgi:cell division protein ZipA